MNDRGFTLVEILVVTAVFGVMLMMLAGLFVKGNTLYREGVERSQHYEQLMDSLDRLTADIKQAREVVSGSTDRMVLRFRDRKRQGRADQYRTYSCCPDGTLEYRDRSGGETILNNVQKLEFHYDRFPPETGHVIVRVTTEVSGRSIPMVTGAYLRNNQNTFRYFDSP